MKILLLTPGTGNFHCGSCLRDESLLRALRKLGHDAAINALYLPLVLDDNEGIDGDDVQMGGINLYLHSRSRLFRLLPRIIVKWLDRPGLLRKAARRADMTSPEDLGRMTEQMLLGTHGKTSHEIERLLSHLSEHDTPDVVVLSNALLLGLAKPIREKLGCKVACTLQGEDTFIDRLPQPWRGLAWGLMTERAKDVDGFMPVSRHHESVMAQRMAIPDDKLHVVYNGIVIDHYPTQDTPPNPPVIGYLARLCEDKGLSMLVSAYLLMHERGTLGETRLHLVGAATPGDDAYVIAQFRRLYDAGLKDRVTIDRNVSFEKKVQSLRGMSVLSVPATYGESFGLYVLEANACGVPAVEPDHAGLAEVIGQTGGGILYPPDDPAALADALTDLLADEPRRKALGQAGRRSVQQHFTSAQMAANVASVLETLCPAPSN